TDKITTEVILVVTPHIVRKLHPPQLAKHTMWSGTAQQYATKRQFMTNQPGSTSLYNDAGGEISSQFGSTPPPLTDEPLVESKKADLDPLEPDQERSKAPQPGVSGLQVIPTAASIKIGEQISLTLQGQNFSSAERTSLVLTYDPAVMTFKQAIEGPFWTAQQVPPSLTISAIPNVGQLVIQMGQEGKPVQGSGALASLVFEATGAGTSNIHIQNPTVLGANAQPVPVMVQHGRVWVE
ncbi:MAG: cohesin domain-containing protein, partial [Nitrospirota bacterium]|nr:cohesin domain-containing protein [Nitrospirota bacterium]